MQSPFANSSIREQIQKEFDKWSASDDSDIAAFCNKIATKYGDAFRALTLLEWSSVMFGVFLVVKYNLSLDEVLPIMEHSFTLGAFHAARELHHSIGLYDHVEKACATYYEMVHKELTSPVYLPAAPVSASSLLEKKKRAISEDEENPKKKTKKNSKKSKKEEESDEAKKAKKEKAKEAKRQRDIRYRQKKKEEDEKKKVEQSKQLQDIIDSELANVTGSNEPSKEEQEDDEDEQVKEVPKPDAEMKDKEEQESADAVAETKKSEETPRPAPAAAAASTANKKPEEEKKDAPAPVAPATPKKAADTPKKQEETPIDEMVDYEVEPDNNFVDDDEAKPAAVISDTPAPPSVAPPSTNATAKSAPKSPAKADASTPTPAPSAAAAARKPAGLTVSSPYSRIFKIMRDRDGKLVAVAARSNAPATKIKDIPIADLPSPLVQQFVGDFQAELQDIEFKSVPGEPVPQIEAIGLDTDSTSPVITIDFPTKENGTKVWKRDRPPQFFPVNSRDKIIAICNEILDKIRRN